MDARNIEHLAKLFARPDVNQALTTLRAAIQVRGDLALGDECLMVYRGPDGELTATSVRIELDDSRSEFDAELTVEQQRAAELLWRVGLANARSAEDVAPTDTSEFLATQADQTALRLGIRLNEHEEDHLSVYPGPLPKP